MPKKKIKDLTLGEIIEITEKHKESCTRCPLYEVKHLPCYRLCQNDMGYLEKMKESFNDQEIEVEEDENN